MLWCTCLLCIWAVHVSLSLSLSLSVLVRSSLFLLSKQSCVEWSSSLRRTAGQCVSSQNVFVFGLNLKYAVTWKILASQYFSNWRLHTWSSTKVFDCTDKLVFWTDCHSTVEYWLLKMGLLHKLLIVKLKLYIYDACIHHLIWNNIYLKIFTNRNTIVPFTIKLIYKMLVFIYYFYIGWISNLHPIIVNSEVCTGTPQYQIFILVINYFIMPWFSIFCFSAL